ncbi:tetratricopeptide repeat protein [Sporosarcina soli]|uniref:Tetratricopeptide repeat protein n=1 Tax=Sporosarcina soli TaxID=334736 RepID=A0ABW0TND9_9BACL
MTMKIEENRLRLPTYSSYEQRSRLYDEFDKYPNASLILLMGDSGYGKTTFVSNYIREKNLPTVWIQLAGTERYVHMFLSYLKVGICKLKNEEYPIETVLPKNTELELEEIASLLSRQSTPMYIVLDDYQSVDASPEIGFLLTTLINRASSMVKFIVISRVRPSLSMTKLKMEQKYMELSTADLAFTFEETKEFYNTTHKLALEDHELQLIHKTTEGWIASYQLILGVIGKMNHQERSLFWSTFPKVQDIYDYLSTEVIQSQPDDIKLFLYRTSLLPELDPIVIDELLGIQKSGEILNHLLNHHLFIYRDGLGILRYHRLFRQFLYQNYKGLVTIELINREHLKLAAIYEGRFQLINAFAHYTVGKDYINATKVMGMIGNRYNPVESMLLLDGWLDEISPDESFASNTLFLIRCIPLSAFNELTVLFEKSISVLQKEKSELWLCNLQHRLATIYLVRGDIQTAKDLFHKSLASSERFHNHTTNALNLTLLAEIYRYLGNYSKAMAYVRESLFISDKYRIRHTQIQALDTMATIYLDDKNTEEASLYIHQALELAQQFDKASLFFVYTTMGRLFRIKEDFAKSQDWGTKAVAIAESYRAEFDIGWSAHELGKSYLENGQLEKAEHFLEKASHASSLFTLYHCEVGMTQLELYKKRGDGKRAAKKQAELLKFLKEHNYDWMFNQIEETDNKEEEKLPRLVIRTLGCFKLFFNDEQLIIKRSSSLRLLQYFITNRNKQIERDIILDAVFPEGSFETVHNQFHVAVSVLRKVLEPNLTSGTRSRFIKRSGNHYLFCTEEIDLDIERFTFLTSVQDNHDSEDTIHNLQQAISLFQGDYFEEYPYELFLEAERERLRTLYIKTSRRLADFYYAQKEYNTCFEYFEGILKKDPDHEQSYLDYLELLLIQKCTLKASSIASQMIQHFEREMGIDVEESVTTLFVKYDHPASLQRIGN